MPLRKSRNIVKLRLHVLNASANCNAIFEALGSEYLIANCSKILYLIGINASKIEPSEVKRSRARSNLG